MPRPIVVFAFAVAGFCALMAIPMCGGVVALVLRERESAEEARRWNARNQPAMDRRERIVAELSTHGLPEWAGTYWFGIDRSQLSVAPTSGVTYFVKDDSNQREFWNQGTVVTSSALRVELEYATPIELSETTHYHMGRAIPDLARAFVLIPWRERDYLVPEDRMLAFCNAVNDGTELTRAHSRFLWKVRRNPDRSSIALALPPVPAEYRKYLLDGEVTATVISAESKRTDESPPDTRTFAITARIDAGKDRKLEKGMLLFCSWMHGYLEGELLDVGETTSTIVLHHGLVSPSEPPAVTAGTKMSSIRPTR